MWTIVAKERPYPPLLMSTVGKSITGSLNSTLGIKLSVVAIVYANESMDWLQKQNEIVREGKKIIKKIGIFAKENIQAIYTETEQLNQYNDKILHADLSAYSIKALGNAIKEGVNRFDTFYVPSYIPILLENGESLLSKKTEEIVRKKVPKDQFADVYISLLTPSQRTILMQEELELLQIIEHHALPLQVFIAHPAFTKHIKHWSWITFNVYNRIGWDKKAFEERTKELYSLNRKERIQYLDSYGVRIQEKQEHLYKSIHFSDTEKLLLQTTCKYGEAKEYRKNCILLYSYAIYHLAKEYAKRWNTTPERILYALPEELIEETFPTIENTILQRMRKCVLLSESGTTRFLMDKDADRFVATTKIGQPILPKTTLKGMPAYAGKVVGKACIVNTIDQADKLNKGDILISTATYPELLPAMKRAAAIVTDEGGITCHAAIVSRELQIPCVIGTQCATKVVSDGDLIEVFADEGRVNIIKKNLKGSQPK